MDLHLGVQEHTRLGLLINDVVNGVIGIKESVDDGVPIAFNPKIDIDFLKDAMVEYTDTFVPGGSFMISDTAATSCSP